MKITSYDKKIFRKETSILNICIENPNVYLCKSMKEYIDFYKCGSKFINNNMNMILFKNNDKLIDSMKNIYENMIENYDILYKLNNINILKYNLLNYFKNLKNKKKYNLLYLTYNINVTNYKELLDKLINDIINHDDYKYIEIL